jgi:hypothetical protein
MFGMIASLVMLGGRFVVLPGVNNESRPPIVYGFGYVSVTRVFFFPPPTANARSTWREASEQLPPPDAVNVPENVVVDQVVVVLNVHSGCTPAPCK